MNKKTEEVCSISVFWIDFFCMTFHFRPLFDDHIYTYTGTITHSKLDDFCSFLYVKRNLCNNHLKVDASCIPKSEGSYCHPKLDVSYLF